MKHERCYFYVNGRHCGKESSHALVDMIAKDKACNLCEEHAKLFNDTTIFQTVRLALLDE